ncbi:hypothetical protein [uncultured Aquabacterium sp.]|uniref:hypothetical protein n=1 Tax=Aquabacterium sp. TaxID=1872578 RepID=UPI0025F3DA96|nr:hypothetical protein [uncultured Aquabacterium sp.]
MPTDRSSRPTPFMRHGPWWPGVVLLFGICLALLASGLNTENLRMAIRATARLSLVFFLMAYTAGAVWQLRPGPASAWVRRHRRQWGLLFVASHTVHLVCILLLRRVDPALFHTLVPAATVVTGALAYAVLWAMGASSHDRVAAVMGKVVWARLHLWGSHYLWLSFAVAYGKRALMDPVYTIPMLLLLLAASLRVWCAVVHRTSSVPSRSG